MLSRLAERTRLIKRWKESESMTIKSKKRYGHIPVLKDEVIKALEGKRFIIDGTFGAGGHTQALLDANPENRVLAFDKDITAVKSEKAAYLTERYSSKRFTLVHSCFSRLTDLY